MLISGKLYHLRDVNQVYQDIQEARKPRPAVAPEPPVHAHAAEAEAKMLGQKSASDRQDSARANSFWYKDLTARVRVTIGMLQQLFSRHDGKLGLELIVENLVTWVTDEAKANAGGLTKTAEYEAVEEYLKEHAASDMGMFQDKFQLVYRQKPSGRACAGMPGAAAGVDSGLAAESSSTSSLQKQMNDAQVAENKRVADAIEKIKFYLGLRTGKVPLSIIEGRVATLIPRNVMS